MSLQDRATPDVLAHCRKKGLPGGLRRIKIQAADHTFVRTIGMGLQLLTRIYPEATATVREAG